MACYLCYCECDGWCACMGRVLTWVVCLRWWRASVGDVPVWLMCYCELCRQRARVMCQRGWQGGAPAWVKWTVC